VTGPSLTERLSKFETATLHESGVAAIRSSQIKMLSGDGCATDRALTAVCHPGGDLMVHVAVARAEPGDMLVVPIHDENYGVWGEVLTVAAKARGIVGLVLDGPVGDLAAIRRRGFPVFARGFAFAGQANPASGPLPRRSPAAANRYDSAMSSRRTRAESS
jgi:4-hydroxy-4-methyl-2-oxoglutarate aldolase